MKNTFWKMIKAEGAKLPTLLLYSQIGKDMWTDEGIAAKDFADDLKALGQVAEMDIRINSAGGSVIEGNMIYNLLSQHPAKKNIYIDGMALSIASVIAMAGNKIYMPENALMMIHDPRGDMYGATAEDMRKRAEVMDKIAESMVVAYKSKTGMDEKTVREMMLAETWLSAKDCKEKGFCTEVMEPMQMAASGDISKFKNVPENVKALFASEPAGSASKSAAGKTSGRGPGVEADDAMRQREAEAAVAAQLKTGGKQTMKCSICGGDHEDSACPAMAKATSLAEARAKAQHERAEEIRAAGKTFKCEDLAEKAIKDGVTAEGFKALVLETKFKAQQITDPNPLLGMGDKDLKAYSLVKAIHEYAYKKEVTGLEKEASEATAKTSKKSPEGFFIPPDVMRSQALNQMVHAIRAALGVSPGSQGGYLIGTDVRVSDMVEILRNKTLVAQLGAKMLTGLVGNVAIPRQSGGATAYWLDANGTTTDSEQTFAQLGLTPRRLSALTAFQKELMMQSSLDVEGFVREDLMRVLAIAKDLAAINGAGGSEPLGILNTTGINSVTFGAAATWAKVVDFETQVANVNADTGALAYLTTPAVRGKWKTIEKTANTGRFLWDNGAAPGSGIVNGYRAEATNQVPSNKVLFGNFNDLILADWSGIDVVSDPYTLGAQAMIRVIINLWTDCGVRHAVSFTASTDSGAQ